MAEETIFSKIIRREIPADILYQDEFVTAFRDIHPQAPVHILVVPNKVIPTVNDATADDESMLGRLFTARGQDRGSGRHRRERLSTPGQQWAGRGAGSLSSTRAYPGWTPAWPDVAAST